jgi:hypothetical protein
MLTSIHVTLGVRLQVELGLDQQSSQARLAGTGKWMLWGTVVMYAEDQLRHRVAWGSVFLARIPPFVFAFIASECW